MFWVSKIDFSRTDTSLIDAASNGAKNGIKVYVNIIANLIAFVAFLAFADETVKWITFLVGFDDVGIEFFLGKMFIPVSWALGVAWEDCEAVGHVIGTKTLINEFVAFRLLGQYKKAGEISVNFMKVNYSFTIYVFLILASIFCNCNLRYMWVC